MLLDAVSPPLPYNEPWKASLEERVRMLGSGDRRVAYVYENPDTSTFRYRVYNMVEALGAASPLPGSHAPTSPKVSTSSIARTCWSSAARGMMRWSVVWFPGHAHAACAYCMMSMIWSSIPATLI